MHPGHLTIKCGVLEALLGLRDNRFMHWTHIPIMNLPKSMPSPASGDRWISLVHG
jgi:hypothetical protein